ncbi:MAG: winged helix-turn-helix transcriptional regulator [Paludibacteraceae bacterium]|nr:winged helix-turn-helix transcriptional regulator [Paludibacteraceae bacterium]
MGSWEDILKKEKNYSFHRNSIWRFDGVGIWTVFYNKVNPKRGEISSGKTREKIVDAIKNNPTITSRELATLIVITTKGIEWQLKVLQTKGIIRRAGPDKGGHWEVIENDK